MAIEIIALGGPVQLTGNPIWIKISGASVPAGSSNYKLLLKVTSTDGLLFGGPFVDSISPDENGEAMFDISGYVDQPATIDFEWPAVGGIRDVRAAVFNITIEGGESYIDSDGNLQESYSDSDTLKLIKGGVSDERVCEFNQIYSSFYNNWIGLGKFLTNQPNFARVSPTQLVKLWLYCFNPNLTFQNATMKLVVKLNNEVEYMWITSPIVLDPESGLLEFSINPAHNGLDPMYVPYVEWFEFSIENENEEPISEVRTFIVDSNYHENNNYLLVGNSFNVIDVIWLSGRVEKSIEIDGSEGVKPKGYTTDIRIGSILTTGKSGRRKWKINTGYKSAEEMTGLIDVYLARFLWLYIDGKLIPVTLANKNQMLTDSMNDLHETDLELLEAHNMQFA